MPKVNIYEPLGGLPAQDEQRRRVQVGWHKGQHAQIGIGYTVKPGTEQSVGDGPVPDWAGDFIIEGEHDEQGRPWRSQWVNLDRGTINQLIRELRNARDQAFGKDE